MMLPKTKKLLARVAELEAEVAAEKETCSALRVKVSGRDSAIENLNLDLAREKLRGVEALDEYRSGMNTESVTCALRDVLAVLESLAALDEYDAARLQVPAVVAAAKKTLDG